MPHDELAEQSAVYALEIMRLQRINADMLAALEDLRASVQKWAPQIDQSRARAAIAKAKGE
jgi:hypothetical protein